MFQCCSLLVCNGGQKNAASRNLFQCKLLYSSVINLQGGKKKKSGQCISVTNTVTNIHKTNEKSKTAFSNGKCDEAPHFFHHILQGRKLLCNPQQKRNTATQGRNALETKQFCLCKGAYCVKFQA